MGGRIKNNNFLWCGHSLDYVMKLTMKGWLTCCAICTRKILLSKGWKEIHIIFRGGEYREFFFFLSLNATLEKWKKNEVRML